MNKNKLHRPSLAVILGLNEFAGRTSQDDPLKTFLFSLEIDGFARAGAMEITGFGEAEAEVVEYREGGDNATVRKSPGLVSFPELVVKRGLLVGSSRGGDDDYVKWFNQVFDVNSAAAPREFRRTVDIVLYDRTRRERRRLRYYECWPSKLKAGGDLDATASEDHIEELTLQNEGYTIITS